MTESVAQLDAILAETAQPVNPLRHHQIVNYTEEARRLGAVLQKRDMDGTPGQGWITGDVSGASRRIREINTILTGQAPKRITGPRANQVHALATQVIQESIKPAMLPRSIMRRNPAGAVGQFQRSEASPAFKRAALAVKRAIRALDPENPDPDLTNLERFRPEGSPVDGTASFMSDATIPGYHAMTPLAKAHWPLGEPTVDTAQKQAARVKIAQGTATRKPSRAKKPATPAQLAHMARLNAAHAAKRSGAGQDQPTTEA